MGGCLFQPLTEVTDNADVSQYRSVGLTAIFTSQKSEVDATGFGMLYVKGCKLCHEKVLLTNRLMCRCRRKMWKLSEIREITVIDQEEHLTLPAPEITIIPPLNPGIKIVLKNSFGKKTTLVMALSQDTIASANCFCSALHTAAAAAMTAT